MFTGSSWAAIPEPFTWQRRRRDAWWLRLYTYLFKLDPRYWRHQLALDLISRADWEAVQLPDRLFWLYACIRPFGWLFRRPR
jgi:hypothetical protein